MRKDVDLSYFLMLQFSLLLYNEIRHGGMLFMKTIQQLFRWGYHLFCK